MKKETLTPRERWLAVLKREKPDRIPMDWWATEEVEKEIMKYLGCGSMDEVFKKLHIDVLIWVTPKYIGPPIPEDSDVFGCRYKKVSYGTGVYRECIYHPLAKYKTVEEIERNYR